jgi:hypothetical protein
MTVSNGTRIGHIRTNFGDHGYTGYDPLPLVSRRLIDYGSEFNVNLVSFGSWENGDDFFMEMGGFAETGWGAIYLFPYMLTQSQAYRGIAQAVNRGFCKISRPNYNTQKCYHFRSGSTRSQCMPIVRSATSIQLV